MCDVDFKWTATMSIQGKAIGNGERTRDCEFTVSVDSEKALIHRIHKVLSPENVSDLRSDQCHALSSSKCPATRHRSLLALPRLPRANITTPLTHTAFPTDFHQYGPLRGYKNPRPFDSTSSQQASSIHPTGSSNLNVECTVLVIIGSACSLARPELDLCQ